jgi:SOS response regulatory protein OraA/RecX
VRIKKFGEMLPETVNDKARQLQFLRYRGFTSSHTRSLFRDDTFI